MYSATPLSTAASTPSNVAAATFDVSLNVYDISDGLARTWSPVLLGKRIEGVWHTGVQVYGMEYFYGGGIVKMRPNDVTRIYGLTPLRTHRMGMTAVEQREFEKYLISIQGSFHRQCYDIIKWNCNNFSDHVCHFLLDKGIPRYILDLPESVTDTFMGKIIVNCIRKFSDAPAIDSDAAEHPKQNLIVPPAIGARGGRRNSCPSPGVAKLRAASIGGARKTDDFDTGGRRSSYVRHSSNNSTSRFSGSSHTAAPTSPPPLPSNRSRHRAHGATPPPAVPNDADSVVSVARQQRRCSVPCILPNSPQSEDDVLTPPPMTKPLGRGSHRAASGAANRVRRDSKASQQQQALQHSTAVHITS